MQTHTLTTQSTAQGSRSLAQLAPALFAILLGLGLFLIVGFAPVAEVHNAAHDVRHSATFPCH